jgi:hypothetical protein
MTTNGKVTIREVAYGTDHGFTEVERQAVLWQYRTSLALGGFADALYALCDEADRANLERIGEGWPELAEAVSRWRNESGFASSVRDRLDFS